MELLETFQKQEIVMLNKKAMVQNIHSLIKMMFLKSPPTLKIHPRDNLGLISNSLFSFVGIRSSIEFPINGSLIQSMLTLNQIVLLKPRENTFKTTLDLPPTMLVSRLQVKIP